MPNTQNILIRCKFIESKTLFDHDPLVNSKKNLPYDLISLKISDFSSLPAKLIDDLNSFFIENNIISSLFDTTTPPFEGRVTGYAKDAPKILGFLLALKKQFGQIFLISLHDLTNIIPLLVERGHLKPDEGNYYLQNIPAGIALIEHEKSILCKGDYKEALQRAISYNEGKGTRSQKATLYWLIKSFVFFNYSDLQDSFLIPSNLLASITNLYDYEIFSPTQAVLLEQFFMAGNIKTITLDLCNINNSFAKFVAASSSLKILDLAKTDQDKSTHDYFKFFIQSLETNESLNAISLRNQPLTYIELNLLFEELKNFDYLEEINLQGCHITNEGAKIILEFLDCCSCQYYPKIYLENNFIDRKLIEKIYKRTGQNQLNENVTNDSNDNNNIIQTFEYNINLLKH